MAVLNEQSEVKNVIDQEVNDLIEEFKTQYADAYDALVEQGLEHGYRYQISRLDSDYLVDMTDALGAADSYNTKTGRQFYDMLDAEIERRGNMSDDYLEMYNRRYGHI